MAARDVFINCPFDDDYHRLFLAAVFVVVRSGFRARCALEVDDAVENRLAKIVRVIRECPYAIHDISRTETNGEPPLPRFNMPLELGIFLGAQAFGDRLQKQKRCIVLDRERHRYQRFISDIAGQDIHSHGGDAGALIAEIAAWLRAQSRDPRVPGGRAIVEEYQTFLRRLPGICAVRRLDQAELGFHDYAQLFTEYIDEIISEQPLRE